MAQSNLCYSITIKEEIFNIYMKQISSNIYANFQPKKLQGTSKVTAIQLGYSGVGKTYLLNNLCNTSHPIGAALSKITNMITCGQSIHKDKGILHIYDTPGIVQGSNESLLQIQRALRYMNWSLIIILTKLDARYKITTLQYMKRFLRVLRQDSDRILFMVSYADILSTEKQTIFKFGQALKQSQITQKVILFSNLNSNFKILSQMIYECAAEHPPKSIQINNKTFAKFLDCQNYQNKHKEQLQKFSQQLSAQLQNINHHSIEHYNIKIREIVSKILKDENEIDRNALIYTFERYIAEKLPPRENAIPQQTNHTKQMERTQGISSNKYYLKLPYKKSILEKRLKPRDGKQFQNFSIQTTILKHSKIYTADSRFFNMTLAQFAHPNK